MALSPDQLEVRRSGITATDIAAIVGVHPHRSRIDVWREKRGELPPWDGNERSKWGELLEPVVRADYAERHNVRVDLPGTVRNTAQTGRRWMLATPDGIVYPYAAPDPDRGLEIKCHTWRFGHLYGAPGSDEVPLWELCQCMWGMAVTGLSRWDLVAFLDGQPTEYAIDADEELIGQLHDQAAQFYRDNVVGGAVPEPDGTEHFTDWLTAHWRKTTGALIDLDVADNPEVRQLVGDARVMHKDAADLERDMDVCIQKLKKLIADADGFTWMERGKVQKLTWKHNKPSYRIAHSTMAGDMRDDARLTLSAMAETIDRAMICLERAGTDPIGENTRAAITAREVMGLVQNLSRALRAISDRTDAKYTTEVTGARPFCWPRSWSTKATDKEQK